MSEESFEIIMDGSMEKLASILNACTYFRILGDHSRLFGENTRLSRSSRIEFVHEISHAREFMHDGVVYTIIKEEVGKMGQVVENFLMNHSRLSEEDIRAVEKFKN